MKTSSITKTRVFVLDVPEVQTILKQIWNMSIRARNAKVSFVMVSKEFVCLLRRYLRV